MRVLLLTLLVALCHHAVAEQDNTPDVPEEAVAFKITSGGDDDFEELSDDQEVDMSSFFSALFENNEAEIAAREGRALEGEESEVKDGADFRAVSDESTIQKYNQFMDALLARVNVELKTSGDPLNVRLAKQQGGKKKGGKKNNQNKTQGGKKNKKSGKKNKSNPRSNTDMTPSDSEGNKKARKSGGRKRGSRHPKDLNLDDLDTEEKTVEETVEEFAAEESRVKRDVDEEQDDDDDDKVESEVEERSARQSKDMKLGRSGLGMEKRRAQERRAKSGNQAGKRKGQRKQKKGARRNNKKGGKKNKSDKKAGKGKKVQTNKNLDRISKSLRRSLKKRRQALAKRNRRQTRRARSNDSVRSADLPRTESLSKKSGKAVTQAVVTGFSTIGRVGDVEIKQNDKQQQIKASIEIGPVTVEVSRKVGGDTRSARTIASKVPGHVTVTINKSGSAGISQIKFSKPADLKTTGSLAGEDAKQKVRNKQEKFLKTSVKKVTPQVTKKVKNAFRTVLSSTAPSSRRSQA